MKTDCAHKVYYCLITGGNRCRKCNKLLNDFGFDYEEVKSVEPPKKLKNKPLTIVK